MYSQTSLKTIGILLCTSLIIGCSSRSSDGQGITGTSGDFVVLDTVPHNNGQVFLNESLVFDFSNFIDLESADFNAMSFAVADLNGKQLSEPVEGEFRLATSSSDEPVLNAATGAVIRGRRLLFQPSFPTSDSFDNGGFRPGREYIVQLVQGDHRRNVGLLDTSGKGLKTPVSLSFKTADGTTPGQLFRDTRAGGPRKVDFAATPMDPRTQEVELNQLGQVATEIRLSFDQPLNPHSTNLPVKVDLAPSSRSVATRGRIFLEYDDPRGASTWIPAEVELARNQLDGATVILRPFGILPNHARIRVIVEAELEDMSGESNLGLASYDRVFGEFETQGSYQVGFDALVENFVSVDRINLQAGFVEPLAEIVPGAIRANFDFEGSDTNLTYAPNTQEVLLNTDFTQIQPANGSPINVANGVFNFKNVTIPAGVTVRGIGSKPMVWLVTGDFKVEGTLMVSGGAGQRVDTLNSANFPSGGGVGNCGGGNGGQASQITSGRTKIAERGFGPGQVPNVGGGGGIIACGGSCRGGSGGGGGTFATRGDPYYKADPTAQWVQPRGFGAFGCQNRNSRQFPGGDPGRAVFVDARLDNDFWGAAVSINLGRRITGELSAALGGQGGGGGGDYSTTTGSCAAPDRRNFANDQKGGGGGAGGGVLIIKALGSIVVTKTGRILAEGGNGGGGAFAGSCTDGGGGGGGSGGMIVLMAGRRIQIEQHGGTYGKDNDYDFAISADGGVGLLDTYSSSLGQIVSKYVPSPHLAGTATRMNARPCGGFGGLGLIQLMAPPGPNPGEDDQTNTVLDDSIDIIDPVTKTKLLGSEKMRYLAWRGLIDPQGVPRDDAGLEVTIGKNAGDMRPSPLFLPAPFGTRSRIRSHWIDLGAADRRVTNPGGDSLPRGVSPGGSHTQGDSYGPRPEFSTLTSGDMQTDGLAGYIATRPSAASGVDIAYPVVRGAVDLAVARVENHDYKPTSDPKSYYRGHRKYALVTLSAPNPALAALPGRFSHYFATLSTDQAQVPGEFRILGHDDRRIYLSREAGSIPNLPSANATGIKLTITNKLFSVFTNNTEGFPQAFAGRPGSSELIPRANIRIGFAFHQDPSDASAKRFPALQPNSRQPTFFADWDNPTRLAELHRGGYRYVMYDILFNTQYQESLSRPNLNSLGPDTPRPELRRLVLPYRF